MRSPVADAGDIFWVHFPGAVGTKRRPSVIISSNQYHTARPDIIVGLLTTQVAKATGPTDHALTDWRAAGLPLASAFRAHLATLPRTAIISRIGRLSAPIGEGCKNVSSGQSCSPEPLTNFPCAV